MQKQVLVLNRSYEQVDLNELVKNKKLQNINLSYTNVGDIIQLANLTIFLNLKELNTSGIKGLIEIEKYTDFKNNGGDLVIYHDRNQKYITNSMIDKIRSVSSYSEIDPICTTTRKEDEVDKLALEYKILLHTTYPYKNVGTSFGGYKKSKKRKSKERSKKSNIKVKSKSKV